jgi:hypothetical protein
VAGAMARLRGSRAQPHPRQALWPTIQCLARSNKTRTGRKPTKKRFDSVHDEHSALANAAT